MKSVCRWVGTEAYRISPDIEAHYYSPSHGELYIKHACRLILIVTHSSNVLLFEQRQHYQVLEKVNEHV